MIVNQYCRPVTSVPHPSETENKLYFLADVPHPIKNLKAALLNNVVFKLDSTQVQKFNLSSDVITTRPIRKLIGFQQAKGLRLAPKLSANCLESSHFEKMKVSHAVNFFYPPSQRSIKVHGRKCAKN